jgi:hypothetical protein
LQIECVDHGGSTAYLFVAHDHVSETDKVASTNSLHDANERRETVDFDPSLDPR